MVKKSLFLFFILSILYSVFVASFAPSWWNASQNQVQDNLITTENIIYKKEDNYQNVIVGTSLSCRLFLDSLPNTYNLSFGGYSIYDGLKILSELKQSPKHIYIESNFILKSENAAFLSSIFNPINYSKKNICSLRESKQPIAIIGKKISDEYTHNYLKKIKRILTYNPFIWKLNLIFNLNGEKKHLPTDDIFKKMITLQKQEYSKLPNNDQVNERINFLAKQIEILEKKGSEIIFFEMPVNKEIKNLIRPKLIRETLYSRFPKSRYKHILNADSSEYKTTDGIHLGNQEALNFTCYLKSKML